MSSFPNEGYLYVHCGDQRFVEESAASARSLRKVDPQAHITLVTDREPAGGAAGPASAFDQIVIEPFLEENAPEMQIEKGNRWPQGYKLVFQYRVQHLYAASPYRKTFFVDSDTYFVDSCRSIFSLLDYYDLCMAQAPADEIPAGIEGKPLTGYTTYNCGVMVYRKNEAVEALFQKWRSLYANRMNEYVNNDQPALMEALLGSPCRIYVLQSVWNARFPFYERFVGKVRLLHGRHRNLPLIARRINATTGNRAWLPRAQTCVSKEMGVTDAARVVVAYLRQIPVAFLRNIVRAFRGGPEKS